MAAGHDRPRPRTPKGRTREVARRLAETYPDAVCELDHRNPFELLVATILSAQTTDVRVNMVTPALFARYPTPAALAAADPGERRGDHPLDRLLPEQDEEPHRHGQRRSSSASAARCRRRWRTSSPSPGSAARRPTSCAASPSACPACPVDTHVGRLSRRLGLTAHDDPVKVELELNSYLPAGRAGRLQPADDPPRPPGVLRQAPGVRGVYAGGHLPVESAAPPAPHGVARLDGGHVALACLVPGQWYDGCNQPGSRHLVCSDSRDPPPGVARATAPPTRGRRRFSAPCGSSARSRWLASLTARCSSPLGRAQRALGLVDRRHEIVTFGAEVRHGRDRRPGAGTRRSPRRRRSARRRSCRRRGYP